MNNISKIVYEGRTFFTGTADPQESLYIRYVFSHYDFHNLAPVEYRKHKNHKDTLLSIPREKSQKFMQFMSPSEGETVMELGAFEGFGTIYLSDRVSLSGKVIAVECLKENYDILWKNIEVNKIANVIALNEFVWSKNIRLQYSKVGANFRRGKNQASMLGGSERNAEAETTTIDDIMSKNKLDRIDLMILEINASELEVLKGARKFLGQDRARVVAAGWYKYKGKRLSAQIKVLLEKFGFTVIIGKFGRVYAIKGY